MTGEDVLTARDIKPAVKLLTWCHPLVIFVRRHAVVECGRRLLQPSALLVSSLAGTSRIYALRDCKDAPDSHVIFSLDICTFLSFTIRYSFFVSFI